MTSQFAPRPKPAGRPNRPWLLSGLVILGMLALLYFYRWWMLDGRLLSPWALLLLPALGYGLAQPFANWLLYLAARRRGAPPPPPPGLTVDVFVTAYKEPYSLIERSLTAACAMTGAHRTWLLDDNADPALARLAARLGAGYLTRAERVGNKPGNVNAALARTTGDIVVIFDADHAPRPDFLERSLGFFTDPTVGFVQVMLTFVNSQQAWIARSAVETSLDFYNPTSLGMDKLGSATMMGSNALIRRAALASIGGYQYGLADDLATSLALHAAGWQSVYVAEPLAPGLAPPDLTAWFTQQFKWARGVFEVQLTLYPRLFPRLTWGQRLAYAVRVTYYWAGPVLAAHLLLTLLVLFSGSSEWRSDFQQYLVHLLPLGLVSVVIRQVALYTWKHPSVSTSLLGNAVSLVIATWPIYTLAWLMAVLRRPLAFRLTPKEPSGVLRPLWLLPHAVSVLLLLSGIFYSGVFLKEFDSLLMVGFALGQGAPLALILGYWARVRRLPAASDEPWATGAAAQ